MRRERDQPETEYNKAPLNAGSLRRLLKLALPYKNILIGAGALVLVSTGISLSIPLISQQILDRVLKSHDIGLLDKLALGTITLILLGAVIGYAQSIFDYRRFGGWSSKQSPAILCRCVSTCNLSI